MNFGLDELYVWLDEVNSRLTDSMSLYILHVFVSLVTLQVHYTQINLHSFYISSHVCVGDHTIRLGEVT